ncbi:MAG TPA: ABC transporter permease [Acidimicrobiales bacterium]|nr:ABC transporter permease [Acidimicrobiales bacterium]
MDSPPLGQGFVLEGELTPLPQLWSELWQSRELIAILARKDFYVRYRRASLGLLWAVGLPLFQALVLALVFSRVVRVHTGSNFAVFVLTGMVGWTYFSNTLSVASTSIVDGSGLSTRIYFPRAVLPMVSVIANLYGYAITLVITLVLCPLLGVGLGVHTLWILPATALAVAVTAGACMVTSALHVYFRDVRYIVTAAVIGWFYLTPVFYPLSLVHGVLRAVVVANPLTGVVELMRAATAGADADWAKTVGVSVIWTLLLLGAGASLHRRFNRVFTDLL